MSDVSVGHEEMNIACAIVAIKAAVRAGVAPVPLAVKLCPPGSEHAGWRQAAIDHLDRKKNAILSRGDQLAGIVRQQKKQQEYMEFNDRLDFDEQRRRNP